MAHVTLSDDGDHGFQIAPMVDVVFVLLLFFMALAGTHEIERRVDASIPGRQSDAIEVPIFVDLAADGSVSINGLAVVMQRDADAGGLDRWISRYRDMITDGTPFVVRPQGEARHERVVQVLNSIRRAGIAKVALR